MYKKEMKKMLKKNTKKELKRIVNNEMETKLRLERIERSEKDRNRMLNWLFSDQKLKRQPGWRLQ